MKNGSFIRDNGTSLTLIVGKETQVFNYKNFTIGPWCSEEINMTVILEIPENYEFDRENAGYEFTLEIYNKCGDEGTMTFEEAIKHLKGYHHGEEFHHKVYMNTIYGIIVGVCLAVIFLVVFGISVLYYRHHSERKKSRSASFGIPEVIRRLHISTFPYSLFGKKRHTQTEKKADHHIRMKMKRRSEVRRASRALAEARRSSKATDGRRISEDVAKKPDRTIDIKMVRF